MSALVQDEVEEGALRAKQSALYDRQIRLWGVEAQNRMQNSKVFVLGFRGVHCEVVKNIVLAGISVVLCDRGNVSFDDLASNFFLRVEDVGRPRVNAALTRVQEYNPLTSVTAESRSLDELLENGAVYFEDFSVILLSDCSEGDVLRLNTLSRANACKASSKTGIALFWSGCFGTEGWFVCDFGPRFEYKEDQAANTTSAASSSLKAVSFPSVETVLKTKWASAVSRHFPLNATFAKACVLNAFHKKEGRFPEGSCDVTTVSQLVNDLLHENEVTDAAFVASLQASVSQLCVCAGAVVPVMAAVVGGFLAQEVLKAVSLVGEPMQNVFVFNGADNVGKAFPVAMPKKTARVPSAATTSEFEVL